MGYLDDIKNFILDWNVENPVDHWWRAKHKVPFGSPLHLDMDMVDMRIDYEEEELLRKVVEEQERRRDHEENVALGLTHLTGSDKEIVEMSKEEIEKEFEELDVTEYYKNLKESKQEDGKRETN